jgi:light-regulated signal transduction histidine kinase (bacteriophytochrome)
VNHNPAFGQADLTNCERELIHLAASIQPHGVLLVIDENSFRVLQATTNVDLMLGVAHDALVEQALSKLSPALDQQVRQSIAASDLSVPVPVQCVLTLKTGRREFAGHVHRHAAGGLILELEPIGQGVAPVAQSGVDEQTLLALLGDTVQQFSNASSINVLADAAVQRYRELTGYDRVMVYKFDPDGHGKIIGEARNPRLDSLLGHHYPSSDIPQRARELYIRNRVRVLVDVNYQPVPLMPRLHPATGLDLDMSLCALRSMSPLHLQYLKNMGVTATLVISLVRQGRLWGLIAAHHYSPRNLTGSVRAAAEMLAEVLSTRIAAIENYAHAQVEILARRLEQRLIEATSTEGDWRLALFRNPHTLLQPLDATGAALFCDDTISTAGEVPSTPELRRLLLWVDERTDGLHPFSSSSVAASNPEFDSLTPIASGVLAVKLSTSKPDYLMWFRKEQLLTVTWAGDPSKPLIGNDPMELSPRRSFAAWAEIVRGTALPWSSAELALARAIGAALIDIILQVHAVRLLIAQHQMSQIRSTMGSSAEPVAISDAHGRILFCNEAFLKLVGKPTEAFSDLSDLAALFVSADQASLTFDLLRTEHKPWRGELMLNSEGIGERAVSVRAEVVPGPNQSVLGFIVILVDLGDQKRTAEARRQLEQSLSVAALSEGSLLDAHPSPSPDSVINAILTNASLAAMDIADAGASAPVAPLLQELEASTRRATTLYTRIRAAKTVDE